MLKIKKTSKVNLIVLFIKNILIKLEMAGLEPASYEAPHIRLHSISYLWSFTLQVKDKQKNYKASLSILNIRLKRHLIQVLCVSTPIKQPIDKSLNQRQLQLSCKCVFVCTYIFSMIFTCIYQARLCKIWLNHRSRSRSIPFQRTYIHYYNIFFYIVNSFVCFTFIVI